MTAAEYVLLASKIAAAYPSSFIGDETLIDWTERLSEVELDHAHRMVGVLRNLPSPPDPWDWKRARRDTAEIEYFRALPPGPVVDDRTPEERERWEALKAKLREKPVGRSFSAALLEVPDADLAPPSLARVRLCPGVASGEGIRDGRHLLCKLCRDDLCADCDRQKEGPTFVPRTERNCLALKDTLLVASPSSQKMGG